VTELSASQNRDLFRVLEVSRQLAATPDLQTLLEIVEKSSLEVLDCERASVFLHDRETDELYSRVATGVRQVRFSSQAGIAGLVFRGGAVINVPDAYADPRFNPEIDRRTGFRTRNLLTCPLFSWDNTILGVLQVLNKRDGNFEAWHEGLARTFSAQAGVAVQRQFLFDEIATKRRIEHNLAIARKIQQGLLPKRSPALEGFDIAGWNLPADETGGDFFDFQELSAGNLAITLADVADHGIGPALLAAECRALVRASWSHSSELDRIVSLVNQLLAADMPDGGFVTAFFGLLQRSGNRLCYVSAGQGPILYFQGASGSVRELSTQGVPLGLDPDFRYEAPCAVTVSPGDLVVLLTDGFFEWSDTEGKQFGTERLRELIRLHHGLAAVDLIQTLYQAVLGFAGDSPQRDDLTAVVIKKL
jgi:sigma-B regulation protein RsbU (phosphoserine phosphatase)